MSITLRVEPPAGAAAERPWDGEALVFGRGTDADVVCDDGSMSRRHARIASDEGGWFVEDLGSRNGTFLNGVRIDSRARIAAGDIVRIGATTVRVGARAGSPAAAAVDAGVFGTTIFRPVSEILPDSATRPGALDPIRLAARLKALNDFHRALGTAVHLDRLLELLLDHLFAVLHPEEGVILLRQPDGTLATAASRRRPGARGALLVSQRLVAEVAGKSAAALVTDVEADERFASAHSVVGAGIRSILAAPFTDGAASIGMVAIYSRTAIRPFTEADLELLVSLASAATLRIRNVALAEEAAARLVQDRELTLAHEIQMGMLPRALPARPGLDLAARLIPARAVGGDLYDYVLAGDRLWFIVADAAGKGVSAALYMAVTRTLFRAVATQDHGGVAAAVGRMNAELARDNDRQFFVTALVGRLSLESGELTYCNAGHHPILRARDGGLDEIAAGGGGMALGVVEDTPYQEVRETLEPGDLLVLYTDGVTEAVNAGGELFEGARLRQALATCATEPAAAVVERVVCAVQAFATGAPQEDDITVMALRWRSQSRLT